MKQLPLVVIIFTGIAVIFISLLYFFYPVGSSIHYPPCPFHYLTGLYCPGCGSQRALSALVHGRLASAVSFNVLMVCSLPFLAWQAFSVLRNYVMQRPLVPGIFQSPKFAKAVAAVVIIFWIARNIPVSPFTVLAP